MVLVGEGPANTMVRAARGIRLPKGVESWRGFGPGLSASLWSPVASLSGCISIWACCYRSDDPFRKAACLLKEAGEYPEILFGH